MILNDNDRRPANQSQGEPCSNGQNINTNVSEFTSETLVDVCTSSPDNSDGFVANQLVHKNHRRQEVFGIMASPSCEMRSESNGCKDSPRRLSSSTPPSSSDDKLTALQAAVGSPSGPSLRQSDGSAELGNKCGKCQNHEIEISKKGHARDCPFKKCNCLKCRLLDARSDILQVISGKETKLKGTKKDPNCGFCQNHGVKILRKGHVRSCGFGQERHFKLDNCFDCEVHYIRNEVNRLQIKMRRAMKEDRTLSEEQRKTAREAITREEVEKVCNMARLARKKRENILTQQAGESSPSAAMQVSASSLVHSTTPSGSATVPTIVPKIEQTNANNNKHNNHHHRHHSRQQLNQLARQTDVWRPWSQHQVAAAMAAQHQLQLVNPNNHNSSYNNNSNNNNDSGGNHLHYDQSQPPMALPPHRQQPTRRIAAQATVGAAANAQVAGVDRHPISDQQQLASAMTAAAANQTYLINSLQASAQQQQQQQRRAATLSQRINRDELIVRGGEFNHQVNSQPFNQLSPPTTPPAATSATDQPLQLTQRSIQEQQLFNTLFRLIVAQFAGGAQAQADSLGNGGGGS